MRVPWPAAKTIASSSFATYLWALAKNGKDTVAPVGPAMADNRFMRLGL
ncbi:MAG TPA: hypothetical protein VMW62_06965 [Chloroflexota bacterium]|nr:hypothetical protein [Chloroflexota bacterium]